MNWLRTKILRLWFLVITILMFSYGFNLAQNANGCYDNLPVTPDQNACYKHNWRIVAVVIVGWAILWLIRVYFLAKKDWITKSTSSGLSFFGKLNLSLKWLMAFIGGLCLFYFLTTLGGLQ